MIKNITNHYSRRGLWSLFLLCAFPLHLWTLFLAFRDISWLWERTNLFDAIGSLSYGLVFAFLESLLVFGITVLAGYLISNRWSEEKRIILLGTFVWVLALWSIFFQYANLQEWNLSAGMLTMIAGSGHPLRNLYILALLIVLPSVIVPSGLILFSEKFFQFLMDLQDRLSLLTMAYLFFDAFALCIVIYRNL
jgi:hypothetical protein